MGLQIIIKPTLACQFKCDFCSANALNIDPLEINDDVIKIFNTLSVDNVIVTGGDALTLDPIFFEKLLAINDNIKISVTSNLWGFYCNPEKWKNIVANPRIKFVTSFQYGEKRKKPDNSTYSEKDFINVISLFEKYAGYVPQFISVISNENEQYALDHVYLAKKLNTICKLNNMIPVGLSNEYYPRYKMIDLYCKIIDLGLEQYEFYTSNRKNPICPYTIDNLCNVRTLVKKDNKYYLTICEELINTKFQAELDIANISNIKNIPTYENMINEKCLTCKLYRFCNNCKVNTLYAKQDINYCKNMSKYIHKLEEYNFKI